MQITRTLSKLDFYDTDIIRRKGTYTIVDEIDEIGENAFGHYLNLREITIPASVKKIKAYAFANCFNLTTLKFCSAVTVEKGAFDGCHNIKKIALTENVLKDFDYTPCKIELYESYLKSVTNPQADIYIEP